MKTLYKIYWTKNGITTGNGNILLEKAAADEWIKQMNDKYPELKHRAEPVEVEEPGIDY